MLAAFQLPTTRAEWLLLLFGMSGQFVFFMRFAVQWFASERRGRSHIPIAFWYLSLVGGAMTLVYAWLRSDPVFILAQALGLLIYVRNLMLIYRRHARVQGRRQQRMLIADGEDLEEASPVPATDDRVSRAVSVPPVRN